ncbi:hypothetical protein TNCV_4639811 [Trichonephila clavipes]|nr:hypothetical protein TNCV_4639811 [Trichonephila clavipes]
MFDSNSKKNKTEYSIRPVPSVICSHRYDSFKATVNRLLGHIGPYARMLLRSVNLTTTHCLQWLAWSREHAMYVCVFSQNGKDPDK